MVLCLILVSTNVTSSRHGRSRKYQSGNLRVNPVAEFRIVSFRGCMVRGVENRPCRNVLFVRGVVWFD